MQVPLLTLELILVRYQALVRASEQRPILLDGLARIPAKARATLLALLQSAPLAAFLQVADGRGKTTPTGRLFEIFTPMTLQTVTASWTDRRRSPHRVYRRPSRRHTLPDAGPLPDCGMGVGMVVLIARFRSCRLGAGTRHP